MIRNSITFIFNHSSTEYNSCKGPEKDEIDGQLNKKSFYNEDV